MGGRKKRTPPPSFATMGDWHDHFTPMFDDQLNSLAYTSLSAHAKEAYTIIRQEYKGHYTGDFVICPYGTFKKKGVRPNTLSRALLQLECYGFIEIDHGGLEHRPSVYHLIGDWKKIRTEEDLQEAKRKFETELEKKKKGREVSRQLREEMNYQPYGKYTSSNGSDSKEAEKTEGISIEKDISLEEIFGPKITNPIPEQIPKTIATSEICQVPNPILIREEEEYQPRH